MNAIMQHLNWDDLRYFLELARQGSIRSAAKKLGVNQSTVSRRIDAFEKKLNVRLFERLASGYVMTSAGEEMRQTAERMENEVAALDRRVIGRDLQLQGTLRITMPEPLMTHFLVSPLAAFAEQYPGIQLEITASRETLNLSKREADIAIRITNTPPEQAVGRKLLSVAKTVYASQDYLARHNIELARSELRWIGSENESICPQWKRDTGYNDIAMGHQINNISIQLEATKQGMGICALPCFMADPEPSLRRLPPGNLLANMDIWILTHQDLRNTARVRAFMKYMTDAFEASRDLFEGRYQAVKSEHPTSLVNELTG